MKSTTLLFFTALFIGSVSSMIYPIGYRTEIDDDFLIACCIPLDFTQPRSIHYFLRNVFSNKRYTQEYLPFNMCSHLMQFLEQGKKSKQKAVYMESTLRLFYNCLKRAPFVCNKAFSEMLDIVPVIIKSSCRVYDDSLLYADVEKNMMGIFIPTFVSQFSFFKSNPEEFLKNLSHEVALMVENSFKAHDKGAQEQLKQMYVRFLELGVMKLLWSPGSHVESWESVKRISIQLSDSFEMGLITADELDDLYKSLLESYCRFLDLSGSELSNSLIDTIKEDICSGNLLMFELEEQEEFIETKRERMLDVLLETEAKVEARMRGIITDLVVY